MPTIDQLEAVIVASDEDTLPVSQNGIARRVTRSQLLAGVQTALSCTQGLIGRTLPGLGAPHQIVVGGGLSLADGVLSGAPHYSVAALPVSTTLKSTDLIATSQGGLEQAVSVKTLLSVSGVDVSRQVAKTSVGSTRSIADWLGDTVSVAAFGAVGDGVTDDTAAINLAIASGRPVLFGPTTYRVDGQWTVQTSAILIGTAGLTRLSRTAQSGGAWINVTGPSLTGVGITFDAGSLEGDSWGVLIAPTCKKVILRDCEFINSKGATLGSGLTIQARDGLLGEGSIYSVTGCGFHNNTVHGLWIQAASGALVSNCRASNNSAFGICLDFNDPLFQQVVRQSTVTNSSCWNNVRGISVGNYNSTNSEPPRWALENPDAVDITVSNNLCCGNSAYGIAVSGERIQVHENRVIIEDTMSAASGILCNSSFSTITSNNIIGPGAFGIDAGGSADTCIQANFIMDCATGINAGGSQRILIENNNLVSNLRALTFFQVETDGHGRNFSIACSEIWIKENLIHLAPGCQGIFIFDGPEHIEIVGNRFTNYDSETTPDLCWCHTDSVLISCNSVNGLLTSTASAQTLATGMQLVIPDILDKVTTPASTTKIDSVFGIHQLSTKGQITFVKVLSGGQSYTQANVILAGSGSGAAATVYLRDGAVIGIAVLSGGSGYDPATTSATIVGDGTGATVYSFVGLPVPDDKRVTLTCLGPVHFSQGHVGGIQANWTKADITVAGGSEIVLRGYRGAWEAISFINIDYLQPAGDGSVSLKSVQGDLRISPGPGGVMRIRSDSEQAGFTTSFGRGSPEGFVNAPPGSDYRNLDGGAGMTLWIKRTGNTSSGWVAVA